MPFFCMVLKATWRLYNRFLYATCSLLMVLLWLQQSSFVPTSFSICAASECLCSCWFICLVFCGPAAVVPTAFVWRSAVIIWFFCGSTSVAPTTVVWRSAFICWLPCSFAVAVPTNMLFAYKVFGYVAACPSVCFGKMISWYESSGVLPSISGERIFQ